MSSPILSIKNASVSFAKKVLFEDLSFNIFSGDKICLIGKNGAGKTSLMNAVVGKIEFDEGERFVMPNYRIGYLEQSEKMPFDLTIEEYILQDIIIDDHKKYLIDLICKKLKIDKNQLTQNLSGGQRRRAGLAKILVLQPEILLLDEPTNHLDLEVIQWLEEYLKSYPGALLIISHDRKFLEKTSNKIFWLRAGNIKINNQGYVKFDEWASDIIEHENRELSNLEKKFALESGWLQTGVTGRRKRNVGRLHYLHDLRTKLNAQKELVSSNQNNIKIHGSGSFDKDAPQVIASFNNVSKSFDDYNIIKNFSLKILRGEKIGIIGKNGSGKSTFLKMLIGEITPDTGTVKLARDLEFSYFDQQRSLIKEKVTMQEVLCEDGADYVNLAGGKQKHICGYLSDFLFDPKDINTLASTLSGGQQNRLILAKVLADPKNFLILDEPTNDLDMDSLDILQEYLEKYQGTCLIVSHDRDFLDQTVTSILAFEGQDENGVGKISHHLGGYSDYEAYIIKSSKNQEKSEEKATKSVKIAQNRPSSGKIKAEIDKITKKIEKNEAKIYELSEELINTEDRNPANIAHISIEIGALQKEIDSLEEKWLNLENELN